LALSNLIKLQTALAKNQIYYQRMSMMSIVSRFFVGTSIGNRALHYEDRYPYVGGEFVWTGFDYLGEPTPYGGD
jgi:hypothetical protein